MTSGRNNMDNNSDDQLLIMQATIEVNKQNSDEKTKNITEDLTALIASMMNQIKIFESSLDNKYSPKDQ